MKRFCDNFVSMFTYNPQNIHYIITVGPLSFICAFCEIPGEVVHTYPELVRRICIHKKFRHLRSPLNTAICRLSTAIIALKYSYFYGIIKFNAV